MATTTHRVKNDPGSQYPYQQADMWGTIITDRCGLREVRMKDDTGTPVSWIHPDLARRYKLAVESCDMPNFKDFHGKRFDAKEFVWFTWLGRDKVTFCGKFYLAPKRSNIDVVLGEEFVDAHGRARDVCNPYGPRSAHLFTLPRKSTKEKDQIKVNEEANDREAREAAEARKRKKAARKDGKTAEATEQTKL
ncbi:hypothetical protein F4778DRAFT_732582 [Xylariomycetidae sp. FL2044]|nr:hypothetical protein F4778DRAFT_732582 [Xylariomycetidae sp. FL2044]